MSSSSPPVLPVTASYSLRDSYSLDDVCCHIYTLYADLVNEAIRYFYEHVRGLEHASYVKHVSYVKRAYATQHPSHYKRAYDIKHVGSVKHTSHVQYVSYVKHAQYLKHVHDIKQANRNTYAGPRPPGRPPGYGGEDDRPSRYGGEDDRPSRYGGEDNRPSPSTIATFLGWLSGAFGNHEQGRPSPQGRPNIGRFGWRE
ncbi:hypothetical protein LTR91_016833 [Friedmanniomyces endolithicus]|uniref:Uncharacterized protein n=1 Tax=Friedmanniomyces endolithicus TaxID=329885 RepID=A0AAN6QK82_9PEZI|nr:hypothetical protein LTR38_011521 [Friedmanniomyces endolithicus]KAK0818344.1 hypothetical protein LTR75_002657 [Friedmanniomyces endolithicus]KAK0839976.1 hypothetical protein LTR03_010868 [Friedmanniomyces endolithicus]KAK0891742.1 hypothetical protein LTR02_013849 [Friedmanniomyces endolithicus]KAK0903311.1 hypothetical protein LTR57_019261 [Friedmanniomyces endolithicus]